jgi:hypothetical protein
MVSAAISLWSCWAHYWKTRPGPLFWNWIRQCWRGWVCVSAVTRLQRLASDEILSFFQLMIFLLSELASLGFFVGFLFASIMISVVGSAAVNTVIVCFAEAPAEFEANHPELSHEMRTTWRCTRLGLQSAEPCREKSSIYG